MDRFDICEAHALLENDFNVGGILRERPSNARRNESTGVQLHRMGYSNPYSGGFDDLNDDAKEVYMTNVMKWNLPIDSDLKNNIKAYFAKEWLEENHPEIVRQLSAPGPSR